MSEKCWWGDNISCDCSSNSGWGSSSPNECDDCGEYFCSKHLKLHKKRGICEKIINEDEEYELKELEEEKREIEERINLLSKKEQSSGETK